MPWFKQCGTQFLTAGMGYMSLQLTQHHSGGWGFVPLVDALALPRAMACDECWASAGCLPYVACWQGLHSVVPYFCDSKGEGGTESFWYRVVLVILAPVRGKVGQLQGINPLLIWRTGSTGAYQAP
jgi:hypothetical protein